MHLKSLEITGFKSFAKESLLEFKRPITAIVGPNGSGKSNITEAFRFVLGEQSMKSMRGRRGEDLIWNGSPLLSRGSRASVKIVFDNRKKIINIDFDEAAFERAVFRDGKNQYFLNGSQVRLRDVMELLASAHIGLTGHQIVSQGEADRVLNASLKERRSFIEDALGLKIYQFKLEESQKKLLRTEENIKQAEVLRRELAPHIKFLKKQFERLAKAREMREELLKLYREYFVAERFYLTVEKKALAEKKVLPQSKLQTLEKDLEKALALLKSGAGKERRKELLEQEDRLRALREEKNTLARNLGRLEGQLAIWQEGIRKRENQREEKVEVDFKELEALREEVASEIKLLQSSPSLDLARKALEKVLAGLDKMLQSKDVSLKENISQSLNKLSAEKKELDSNFFLLSEEEGKLAALISQSRQKIEEEKDANQEAEKKVLKIQAERNELFNSLARLKDKESQLQMEEEDFQRELRESKALVGEAAASFSSFSGPAVERTIQYERRKSIERIKIKLEDAGGLGEEVEREFEDISQRDTFLSKELEDLGKSAESLKGVIEELEEKLDRSFKEGIEKINKEFQNFFSLMFNGGHARLIVIREKKRKKAASDKDLAEGLEELEEELEEEAEKEKEGIDINISLPRKKIKGLEMLSGGERALTSIALIFAVSQVTPPPFLVLDETDAALDEANSKKYGDMLEALSHSSQLILITHNRETMSRAGIIYGVTMGKEGFSKVLSVEFEEAVSVAK